MLIADSTTTPVWLSQEIGTIGTGWVVHQQDGETHVVYSDVLGITHKSLEDDAICGVSDASEGGESASRAPQGWLTVLYCTAMAVTMPFP